MSPLSKIIHYCLSILWLGLAFFCLWRAFNTTEDLSLALTGAFVAMSLASRWHWKEASK